MNHKLRMVLIRAIEAVIGAIPLSFRAAFFKRLRNTLPGNVLAAFGIVDMRSALAHLANSGFKPDWIIDVGANVGDWARMARAVFPNAAISMFEGNPENNAALARAQQQLGPNASYKLTLLGASNAQAVEFYSMGSGSSVLAEKTDVPREVITLPMCRLDDVTSIPAGASCLLKLDVQGYELEVLRGAAQLLPQVQAVLMEMSLLEYNRGAPLLHQVLEFMRAAGFLAYDIAGLSRRRRDGTLFQIDLVFVRHDHALRQDRAFF